MVPFVNTHNKGSLNSAIRFDLKIKNNLNLSENHFDPPKLKLYTTELTLLLIIMENFLIVLIDLFYVSGIRRSTEV